MLNQIEEFPLIEFGSSSSSYSTKKKQKKN